MQQEPTEDVLTSLETTIKEHIALIDQSKIDLKKMKEMLSDMFANDPTFQEHDKAVKEASKIRAKTKAELLKQPQASDLYAKIREKFAEVKDAQNALSDYLREFQRLSGSNEIEGSDGEVREIVYVARLVKRSSRP